MSLEDKDDACLLVPPHAMPLFPPEIWTRILSYVDGASLFSVVQSCRAFYAIGIRELCSQVAWVKPLSVARSLPFWDANPHFALTVRRVKLSIWDFDHLTPDPTRTLVQVVNLDGSVRTVGSLTGGPVSLRLPEDDGVPFRERGLALPRLSPEVRRTHVVRADHELYLATLDKLRTFVGLRSLCLSHTSLPPAMLDIIHGLPQLRELALERCIIPEISATATQFDHSTLGITDLVLRDLRYKNQWYHPRTPQQFYSLMSARGLRRLRLQLEQDGVLRNFFTPPGEETTAASNEAHRRTAVPTGLVELEYEVRFPARVRGTTRPSVVLHLLLTHSPNLAKLSIVGGYFGERILPDALPCLRELRVRAQDLKSVLTAPSVQALWVDCDDQAKIGAISKVLEHVQGLQLPLQSLTLNLQGWEDELIHAVTVLFPGLRRLDMVYLRGHPSEDTLVSMGHRFLARMPFLEATSVFRLKHTQSHLPGEEASTSHVHADDDLNADPSLEALHHSVLLSWTKHCPNLRCVQLHHSRVWRRADEQDVWVAREPDVLSAFFA
ncbi:hypothetical protein PUNSTDRAFT_138125 [Punctularia strigosozonata HHB-11173 SS5]|uniref:F-box domain-containing protein n=1 Tax=Punctularia strigosozonata (strain HHB-11173) TaxID=741275 RepID=R7S3Z7_PUNST|nr:uncharacterized protein PUNSTDRAFT_138125 [Punctularia strigosozonata HHB-11173 SS5]EIN04938.1 hypothetical protein PUNSTDRAFT_138125 [Punctularia strigosozonata HHB-11173 SS5]